MLFKFSIFNVNCNYTYGMVNMFYIKRYSIAFSVIGAGWAARGGAGGDVVMSCKERLGLIKILILLSFHVKR